MLPLFLNKVCCHLGQTSRHLTKHLRLSSSIAATGCRSVRNQRTFSSKMADASNETEKAQHMVKSAAPSIFTRIINKEIPGKFLHEDDKCVALQDVNPQAPVHFLVVPRKQVPGIADASEEDAALLGHLLLTAKKVAEQQHLTNGYRVVINEGRDGGQSVPHLHVHVLGKRQLVWPPG